MKVIHAMAMRLDLPRLEERRVEDLDDLTTAPLRDAGRLPLHAVQLAPPRKFWTPIKNAVPGRLIEGTLAPDHRARFLLRMPRDWNGGLVVAAAPGTTSEYSYDLYFSDALLLKGYAFAVTDKAVRTVTLDDTVMLAHAPEAHVNLWAERLNAMARFAVEEAKAFYGRLPSRTLSVGVSNGAYVARRAAESSAGIFDGALEVSGVLWRAARGNVLRELPQALRAMSESPWDRTLLERAGMPSVEEPGWQDVARHYHGYWEAVMHLFLGHLDPEYNGAVKDYDLDARPATVLESIHDFENTGDLKVPLVSVAGDRDYLVSCTTNAIAYCDLVKEQGKQALHELIIVPGGLHVDSTVEWFPFATPLMPPALEAFARLEKTLTACRA
jgi:hypothetical protein